MSRLAVMQPYFLPYIGYFQLIGAVDLFIVYDNIKYTKKGWINRNRILQNGSDAPISLPLKRASDSLDIRDRELAADFDREKLLRQVAGAYRKAPYFAETYALVERIVRHEDHNLFHFLRHSIGQVCDRLGVRTEIKTSSQVTIDDRLKGADRVLALCKAVGAQTYVNAIGGADLYSKQTFKNEGVDLMFIKARPFEYHQFSDPFVPWLSIIDVMMFNSDEAISTRITDGFDLI